MAALLSPISIASYGYRSWPGENRDFVANHHKAVDTWRITDRQNVLPLLEFDDRELQLGIESRIGELRQKLEPGSDTK